MDLYDILKEHVGVIHANHSRSEITIRCGYCGDSKDPSHTHLYIKGDPPHPWHCKICEASGPAIGVNFLREMKIRDMGAIEYASKNEKRHQRDSRNKVRKGGTIFDPPQTIIPPKVRMGKLKYVADRLGLEPEELDVQRYRIITDLREFFVANRINELNVTKDELAALQKNYVGFLSADGLMITFRDVTGMYDRYFDYTIYKKSTFDRTYRIATTIDAMAEKVEVVMAEGIISLIGAEKFCEKPGDGRIYVACQGKSYANKLVRLSKMGFLDMDVRIYADTDVSLSFFEKMKRNSLLSDHKFTVHYNKRAEDFGHPREKIDIRRVVVQDSFSPRANYTTRRIQK